MEGLSRGEHIRLECLKLAVKVKTDLKLSRKNATNIAKAYERYVLGYGTEKSNESSHPRN